MAFNFRLQFQGEWFFMYEVCNILQNSRDPDIFKFQWDRIQEEFEDEMEDAYRKQRSGGRKWKALDDVYLKYGKQKGNPRGLATEVRNRYIGRRTHKTFGAFIQGKHPGAIRKRGSNFIKMGVKWRPPLRRYVIFQTSGQPNVGDLQRRVPIRDPLLNIVNKTGKTLRKKIKDSWIGLFNEFWVDLFKAPISISNRVINLRYRRVRGVPVKSSG